MRDEREGEREGEGVGERGEGVGERKRRVQHPVEAKDVSYRNK